MENEHYQPDAVMCLQPTSPLRSDEDIDAVVALLRDGRAESVVSVVSADRHPLWMKTIDEDGCLRDYERQATIPMRRQDLPFVYALNGAVYASRTRPLFERASWYGDCTLGYVMPPERSVDVDTTWDMHLVDLILRAGLEMNHA
jgi:CMP-N-acetylneuraminic acid synthetase